MLLSKVIASEGLSPYKYSSCYNALKSVIELERKQKDEKLPKSIFEKFKKIEDSRNHLDSRIDKFPLLIVEEYLMRNNTSLDKYIFMQYKNLESSDDIQVMEIYTILERFFQEMYHLSVEIADYYSLDVKLKSSSDSEISVF